jgi:hypothetical protein
MIRQLPDTLAVTILLSWIELEDLGRLDAALCNRFERSNYISLVRRPIFVLRNSHGRCHSDEGNQRMDLIIMWLTKRQISSAELTVTTTFPDTGNSWLLYLRGHGTHVVRLISGAIRQPRRSSTLRSCFASYVIIAHTYKPSTAKLVYPRPVKSLSRCTGSTSPT